jgi:hypothetical protein
MTDPGERIGRAFHQDALEAVLPQGTPPALPEAARVTAREVLAPLDYPPCMPRMPSGSPGARRSVCRASVVYDMDCILWRRYLSL